MKSIMLVVMSFLLFACNKKSGETQSQNNSNPNLVSNAEPSENCLPSMLSLSEKSGPVFLHPEKYYGWIEQHRPSNLLIGHVSLVNYRGKSFAVTAPHVIANSDKAFGFPKSSLLGKWKNSTDGREIAFAQIQDWKGFGFTCHPVEVAAPRIKQTAEMKATCFINRVGVRHIVVTGVLEELVTSKDIYELGLQMDNGSAIKDRMLNRAPNARILGMFVDESFDPLMQGCSGAIVWQNGSPVGVFVAKVVIGGYQPFLLIEPLNEAMRPLVAQD